MRCFPPLREGGRGTRPGWVLPSSTRGTSVPFGGAGVSEFAITGVYPNTSALPAQFFFANGQTGSFTQTSLNAAVPEPSSLALIGLGLSVLGVLARRRVRK